ncbi:MAG: putative ABC transporter permease [Clostridiales bacterium]|nr:putative ABC transporter permease [Clostridiales bacterium]
MTAKKFFIDKLPVLITDFLICGLIGWIYETVLTSVVMHTFVDRGVLPIPVLPIYGLFALVLPLIFKRKTNFLVIGLTGALGATVFELISAYITESIFGYQLWTYEGWKFNFFGGRISLFSSLIFGALCVIHIKAVHPLTEFLQKKNGKVFAVFSYLVFAGLTAYCIIVLSSV